jgi:hypothetical protein
MAKRLGAGPTNAVSDGEQKSSCLSPHHRLMIALHSLDKVVGTGPPKCSPEKLAAKLADSRHLRHFLWSSLKANIAKLRPFLAISREKYLRRHHFGATKLERVTLLDFG